MVETEYRLLLPQKLIDITELKKKKKKVGCGDGVRVEVSYLVV